MAQIRRNGRIFVIISISSIAFWKSELNSGNHDNLRFSCISTVYQKIGIKIMILNKHNTPTFDSTED